MVIIAGKVETIPLAENHLRYAKVEILDGTCLQNYYSDGWYVQAVTAIRVNDENGNCLRRIPIPVSSLPDYGVGQDSVYGFDSTGYKPEYNNRIVFKDGHAYYYHNVYMVTTGEYYGDPELRDPNDRRADNTAYNALIQLAEPEVMDITEIMGFDGMLDLYGGSEIVLEHLLLRDGDFLQDDGMTYWEAARTKLIYEVET